MLTRIHWRALGWLARDLTGWPCAVRPMNAADHDANPRLLGLASMEKYRCLGVDRYRYLIELAVDHMPLERVLMRVFFHECGHIALDAHVVGTNTGRLPTAADIDDSYIACETRAWDYADAQLAKYPRHQLRAIFFRQG